LGYEEFRVGIEYDGPQHWTDPKRRARDIDRQAELEAEGWIIIRVSSDLLHHRTRTVVVRVIEAMTARGWGGRL
jgi:very-short-patch-repair endonuclease